MSKLTTGHTRITDGEIETIGNGLIQVFVIYHMEAMTTEDLFQHMRTLTIDTDLLPEIILTFGGSFQHGSHGKLGTMTGS